MGDAVNLAARLVAKAPAGAGLRHRGRAGPVARRASRRWCSSRSVVKGKAQPVQRVVGRAASRARTARESPIADAAARRPRPAAGRARSRLVAATRGRARAPSSSSSGEAGMGKTPPAATRLRARWPAISPCCTATCEAYTASTPYSVWRELLRQLHRRGLGRRPTETCSTPSCASAVGADAPVCMPWLPLLAIAARPRPAADGGGRRARAGLPRRAAARRRARVPAAH